MTRAKHHHGHPDDRRITLAAVTGLIAGATRAILDTLLQHLTPGC